MPAEKGESVEITVGRFGFVSVGYAKHDSDLHRYRRARTIIRWGTSSGLEELVNGPLQNTKLSAPADGFRPWFSVEHVISVNAEKWEPVLDSDA